MEQGTIDTSVESGVATITFSHPKANSLPLSLLTSLADACRELGRDDAAQVIVLRSAGQKAFCAGASFEEFQRIKDIEAGKAFFMGFANLILAMKAVPKLIISRVQGKAVGGGVGLIAASDYSIASAEAAIRLSEFELGIGPFTIGPAVERRMGASKFAALAIDTQWRSAYWALEAGLYHSVYQAQTDLDSALTELTQRIVASGPLAAVEMKKMLWLGTEHWETLLKERAGISGELLIKSGKKPSAP